MALEKLKLDGEVAIVTGAGRGVGRGIAAALAEAGATIVCSARSKNEIDETVQSIEDRGGKALALTADVMKKADLGKLVEDTMARFGRIDHVINNAGGIDFKPLFADIDEADFQFHFNWNTTSAFMLSKAAVPHMLKAGRGNILNVSSGAGRFAVRGMLSYGVAKAAVEHLTRCLAEELSPKIRANCISLGAIMTPALQQLFDQNPDYRTKLMALTPSQRVGSPESVGLAALYFCSQDCYSSGAVLQIDGWMQTTNLPYRPADL